MAAAAPAPPRPADPPPLDDVERFLREAIAGPAPDAAEARRAGPGRAGRASCRRCACGPAC